MNYKKNLSYFYFFIILTLILFSNTYFSFEESLIYGGADGKSYYDISKFSPKLSEVQIQPIHAERFFFPYLIGLISKIITIDIYVLYRILVILIIILINKIIIEFLINFKKNEYFIIITILILNCNPYFTRFYIAAPLILNDLIFIYGSVVCINSLYKKNKKEFFIGLAIASFARQSSAAICISILLLKILKKNKFILSYSDVLVSFIIFIIIYYLGYLYSGNIPMQGTRSDQYYITLFGLLIEKKQAIKLLIYFIWPFLSFGPLILYYLFLVKNNFYIKKMLINLNIFIIFFSFLIILQPILQGLTVSGKNIIRLSTLAYPAILIFLIINSKTSKLKKIIPLFFIILSIVWSSHPTFSIFSYLEKFKF